MQETINISSLWREENMKETHKFSLLSQVLLNIKEEDNYWIEGLSKSLQTAIKANQPFFVISHDRDCDGTPLYTLSLIPFKLNEGTDVHRIILNKIYGDKEKYFVEEGLTAIRIGDEFMSNGISEDCLVPYPLKLEGEII